MKTIGDQTTPRTIGVLASGNQIYFASSITGSGRGYWLGTKQGQEPAYNRLLTAAGRCRLGGMHRNGGRCSEINLLDVFYVVE